MATRSKRRLDRIVTKTKSSDGHFKQVTSKDVELLLSEDIAQPSLTHESPMIDLSDSSQQSQADRSTASPIVLQPQIVWHDGVSSPKLLTHKETTPIQPTSSTPYLRRVWRKQSGGSLSPKRMRMEASREQDRNWLSEVHGLISQLENRSPTGNKVQSKKRLDLPLSTNSDKVEDRLATKLISPEFDMTNPFTDSLSFAEFMDETPAKSMKPAEPPTANRKTECKFPNQPALVGERQVQPYSAQPETNKSVVKQSTSPISHESYNKPTRRPLRRYQSHDAILQNELIEQKRQEALKRLRNHSGKLLRHSSADAMASPRSKFSTQTQQITSKTELDLDKSVSQRDSIRKLTPPCSQESINSLNDSQQSIKQMSKSLKPAIEQVAVLSQICDTTFPNDDEEDLILTQIIEQEIIDQSKKSKQTFNQSKPDCFKENQSTVKKRQSKALKSFKHNSVFNRNEIVKSSSKGPTTCTLSACDPSTHRIQCENQELLTIIEKKRQAALARLKSNS